MNKVVIGNFEGQANKNFPADCELFSSLQTNTAIIMVLGNIAGDKAILRGCELEKNDTSRKAGYVFICTKDYPNGEILLWEGGSITGGMYVKLETVAVSAQGYDYKNAYTVRSLAAGVGIENYKWQDFHTPKDIKAIEKLINAQNETIKKLAPAPLGLVSMWAGTSVPEGYELCDGRELKITECQALYNAIGTTFNGAYAWNGTPYSTTNGYFRLPDLRGRFVVGYNILDSQYNTYGDAGGKKTHQLTTAEMPSHIHSVKDYYFIEAHSTGGISGNEYVGGGRSGSGDTDGDNSYLYYKTHDTYSTGNGSAHENRPPFYTLAYIMKIK